MLSSLRLRRKQNNYWNPFWICIFLFLSSFGIETRSTFIHSVVPSKTIPDFRPKWSVYTRFPTKTAQKPYPIGGGGGVGDTYLYGLYKGVPPGQKTFSNALHLFKKTANSVTYISPLRIRTHVEELLYRRKIWSDESKGKRLETLASNLPTIPYCFYRWVSSKYTLVNLLALEKQHCNAGCVLGLDLLRDSLFQAFR